MIQFDGPHVPIDFAQAVLKKGRQVSTRFVLLSQARSFAENCAMTVRVWRIVRRRRFSDDSIKP